jgi:hypothetical protein
MALSWGTNRCTEVSLVHQVVVGGVGTARSAGTGATVPNAERMDTLFQIIEICWMELETHNLVGQCRRDERCRVGNPQFRSDTAGMGLERNPFEIFGCGRYSVTTFLELKLSGNIVAGVFSHSLRFASASLGNSEQA